MRRYSSRCGRRRAHPELSGLLLVEAKAHESGLDWKGKRALSAETDSPQAWANDGRIRAAIAEAQDWFSQVAGPTALTADSHYQLANRLASAYKVASVGVPVRLLYLGFIGDTYFDDYLRDADHWQQLMRGYLQGVVPSDLPGRALPHTSGGSLLSLERSQLSRNSEHNGLTDSAESIVCAQRLGSWDTALTGRPPTRNVLEQKLFADTCERQYR